MAKTRDYMDYLDSKIEIAPANSQEEYQAAETIAEILRDHDLETTIEEFDSHPFGQIVGPILAIILFVCLVAAGLTEGTVHIVLMVVAALCVGLPLYLHFSGTRLFQDLGPGSTSQNVVAVHRATGDKVIKGARPIVIVAHYDTPRQSLLRKGPLAQYQAAIRMATIPCSIVAAVALLFQFMMFLPGVVITFMWIVGLIAAFPLLLLAIIDIIDHFGSCTTGANDNKSSVAALLSIANKVRPIKDRVDDDSDGREGKPLRRRIHDVPEQPAQPRRIEVLEEVKGVRHGAQVLASLGILPENCEIIYQEPRLQIIEEETATVDDASIDNDHMAAEVDIDEAELAASYDDEEYEEYDDTSEDYVEEDMEEEYSDDEPEEESNEEDEWFDDYDDEDEYDDDYEDDYEDEEEYADEDVEEQHSIDESTDEEDYESDDLEESDEELEEDSENEEMEEDSENEDENDDGDEDEDLDYEDDEEYDDEEWESESVGGRFAAIWEAIKAWFLERIAAIREFFSKDRGSDIDIARGEDRHTKANDSDELDEWMDEYEDDAYEDESSEDEKEDDEEETGLIESEEDDYEDEVEAQEDDEFNNPYDYVDEEILDEDAGFDVPDNDPDDSDSDLDDDIPFFDEYEQMDEEYVDEDETEVFEDTLDDELQDEYEEDYEEDLEDDFEYDDDESYGEYEFEDEGEYIEEIEEVEEEEYTEDDTEYEDAYNEYEEDAYEDDFEEDEYEAEEAIRSNQDATSTNQKDSMSVGERLERFFSMIRSTPAPEGEDDYDDDDELNNDGDPRNQANPYNYSKEGDEYEYEAYAGAYEDREKNEVREVIASGRKSMYTTEYSSDLDKEAYGYEDETYQPGDYEEEAYYDEEYVEAELEFDDKAGVQVPDILPDPNKLHFDREEDADILPRDTTGLDTLSDSYDLYTGKVTRVSNRQKPEPLADPNWGISSYQPARPVMNIARRAALFDLPDPSAEAIDPLYNEQDEYEEETYDEYESYEAYEDDEPYDELTEMEEIVRAEAEESAASYNEPTSGYEMTHEEETGTSADEGRAGRGNVHNATSFWSENRSSSWKGGATMRSDLRDDLNNVPLILDEDDLQDAILELGDDFLVAHDIWFVATGASEVGHAGIRAFIDEHRRDIRGSFLVNLDSIGAGTLSMLVREGMSAPRRADRRLVRMIGDIANDLHVKLDTAMYNFDERESATTMRSRIRSVTIAGLDDNDLPAYSHTANDVPENVDPKQVSDVVRIITELIRRS